MKRFRVEQDVGASTIVAVEVADDMSQESQMEVLKEMLAALNRATREKASA